MSLSQKIIAGNYINRMPYSNRKKDEAVFNAYIEEEARMIREFKKDTLEDLGLTNHPKADKLFDKAWEMGHASGLGEVWTYMQDLAELIL